MNKRVPVEGERAFALVWAGQLVSTLGSNALVFGLSIVAFQEAGQALGLVIVLASRFAPQVLLSPVAGIFADRFPRRIVLIAADVTGALATLALLVLLTAIDPGVGVYAAYSAIIGLCETFQQPAYLASVATLVRKRNFGRAAGMLSLVESAPRVLAPLAAGALLPVLGHVGLAVLDILTFFFALGTLLAARFPEVTVAEQPAPQPRWRRWAADATVGFVYIVRRRSLLALQATFTVVNLVVGMGTGIMLALVLARTGQDESAVGLVQGLGAVGAVAGGIMVSVWGGPRARVRGLLGAAAANLLSGRLLFAWGGSVPVWVFLNALGQFFLPLVNSTNQAIWQVKVEPALQGRVFAARRVLGQITYPVGLLGVGFLIDRVFEPGIVSGDTWFWHAGRTLFGDGAGSSSAFLMALTGVFGLAVTATAGLLPSVRHLEARLPDAVPDDVDDNTTGHSRM